MPSACDFKPLLAAAAAAALCCAEAVAAVHSEVGQP